MGNEKLERRWERYDVKIPIAITIFRNGQRSTFNGEGCDFSRCGMRLFPRRELGTWKQVCSWNSCSPTVQRRLWCEAWSETGMAFTSVSKGWSRLIDLSDPAHPFITGEYMIDQDQLSFCGSSLDTPIAEKFRSFSSHNPTVLRNLAIVGWHSGGVQAIDISDPANPAQGGSF